MLSYFVYSSPEYTIHEQTPLLSHTLLRRNSSPPVAWSSAQPRLPPYFVENSNACFHPSRAVRNVCLSVCPTRLLTAMQALEEVSVSTPRDLVRLGAFPDVLVGAVRARLGAERFAPLAGRITAEAVDAWRRKGDRLLEKRPWLELWVHGG